jgi:hypothetical protein
MPLYEDLVRRAFAAREDSQTLAHSIERVRNLSQLLRDARDGRVMLVRCAWCGSFQVADEWLHLDAIGEGQVAVADELLDRASHGICPPCLDRQLRLSDEHHQHLTDPQNPRG